MRDNRFKEEREQEVLLVAYDYCVLGLRGDLLAKHRHLSPATLARRIRQAKEAGYIREAVLNIPKDAFEEIYPYLYRLDLMEALHNYIGRENLRTLIVIPSASKQEKQSNPLINRERVGRAAAIRFLQLLNENRMQIIGVSAGRTVGFIINEVERSVERSDEHKEKPECVPIYGDLLLTPEHHLLHPDAARCSSSTRLAANLALAIRGNVTGQLDLPVPAYIPRGFMENISDQEIEIRMRMARHFAEAIPAYRKIFGRSMDNGERDPNSLIAQMDTIIISAGGTENGHITGWMGISEEPAYSHIEPVYPGPIYNDREREQLEQEGVIGDLLGYYITEDKVDKFGINSYISKVNNRVLGPTPADLQRCAERARKENLPGVIMAVDGVGKARVAASAIQNRCVTELICDAELAEELAKIKGIEI